MANNAKSRKWALVFNNPLDAGLTHAVLMETLHKFAPTYFCMADEIATTGTYHTHVFLYGDDAAALVMAGVYSDGTIDISSMSIDYNSERNNWIRNQFSAWDGSHVELEKLIISNLNDEKSYEHIETTYRDIATEDDRDEINQILADSGYTQRAQVGDLFTQPQFSAKNAFGGVIKNTAFGIASYSDNTITLIDIG